MLWPSEVRNKRNERSLSLSCHSLISLKLCKDTQSNASEAAANYIRLGSRDISETTSYLNFSFLELVHFAFCTASETIGQNCKAMMKIFLGKSIDLDFRSRLEHWSWNTESLVKHTKKGRWLWSLLGHHVISYTVHIIPAELKPLNFFGGKSNREMFKTMARCYLEKSLVIDYTFIFVPSLLWHFCFFESG